MHYFVLLWNLGCQKATSYLCWIVHMQQPENAFYTETPANLFFLHNVPCFINLKVCCFQSDYWEAAEKQWEFSKIPCGLTQLWYLIHACPYSCWVTRARSTLELLQLGACPKEVTWQRERDFKRSMKSGHKSHMKIKKTHWVVIPYFPERICTLLILLIYFSDSCLAFMLSTFDDLYMKSCFCLSDVRWNDMEYAVLYFWTVFPAFAEQTSCQFSITRKTVCSATFSWKMLAHN